MAGFTVWVIQRTGLWHGCWLGGFGSARDRIEVAGINGRLLSAGRCQRSQVVGRFEAAKPRHAVGHIELFATGVIDVKVERLGLIDPLLPAARAVDQPSGFHFKRSGIFRFQICRDTIDGLHAAIESISGR